MGCSFYGQQSGGDRSHLGRVNSLTDRRRTCTVDQWPALSKALSEVSFVQDTFARVNVDSMVGLGNTMIHRRAFLMGAGCMGIGVRVGLGQAITSESAGRPFGGRKLVPPAKGLIKVACGLSANVTPIDWIGPQ